jgi:hypothetical protein
MDKEKIFDDATRKFVFEATRDYCKTRIEEIHEKNPKIQHFLNESAMEIEKILSEKLGEDWEKFRKAYCAFLSIFEGIQENMPKAKKFGLLEELLGKAKFHA